MGERLRRSEPAQRVSIETENLHLQGSLLIPENAKDTNVLFVRGGAVTFPAAQTFADWQLALGKAGFASLFFDFPGSGGWTPGELADNTLNRRLLWSEDALKYLQHQNPAGKAVIIGSSMGAPQAVALASRHPDLVRGVILSSGGMYSEEALDKSFGPDLSAVLRKPQNYSKSVTVEQMRKLKIPFLIFYAEHDDVIPKEVVELYRSTPVNVHFQILRGVGHKYLSPAGPAEAKVRQIVYETCNQFLEQLS